MRNADILVRKPKKPFGRPRHKWENNNKINFNEIGCEGVDWIQIAQDNIQWQTLVNMAIPYKAENFLIG
jgi:hypothetical protein